MKQRLRLGLIFFLMMYYGGFLDCLAQSGFAALHGEAGGCSYTYGSLFYRQYSSYIVVSEGVEQAYLLCDTIVDDGCANRDYDGYGFTYGDTLAEGLYTARKYIHSARDGYDSVVVHQLWVFPNTVTYDTLLLAESELGSYIVGESVDSLYSSYGCDSVVFRMVYAVACPPDLLTTAPYGVAEIPFPTSNPHVTPSYDGVFVLSDAPPLVSVGHPSHITWQVVVGKDTFRCEQNVRADFPPCGGDFTATDGDGNVYETVRIGYDCWLKKNLYATHYAGTGEPIPVAEIFSADVFPDTVLTEQNYGRLYSWFSAVGIPENSAETPLANADGEVQGVCPVGWHIPSASELSTLQSYSGPDLKATGDLWIGEIPRDGSHFSMAPGGLFNAALNRYERLKAYAYLWLADSNPLEMAYVAYLRYLCSDLVVTCFDKRNECSVRCAKD